MRFVDSNIFLHAFLTPFRKLTEEEQRVKDESKIIVKRIEEGEEVATTTVHLSEVVNIVESGLGLQRSLGFLSWVITKDNIKVYPITVEDYEAALPIAREKDVSANDALAYITMKTHGLTEIYSFDKHFNRLKDIVKLPPL
ncbi:type II toxin-antitoxin system VapC family toxin [Candidatus Bathyarchaeota archaeon]|nr:type II toxin-antitoxin system VapC family toxin [Candidatus Bathyarchaeota archaeon]MBS7618242.1 type II toxin-antitoxin system VapC family toxin [Candidatus Bathyarchaeota archaeon]